MQSYSSSTGHTLIINRDEMLVETITRYAQTQNIRSAMISAIGALKDFELGYYDLHTKTYIKRTFQDDDYELVSMHGNITLKEGKPFVHVHAALGDRKFQLVGGHFFEGKVAVTAEVFIRPEASLLVREHNSDIGLWLIGPLSRCGC